MGQGTASSTVVYIKHFFLVFLVKLNFTWANPAANEVMIPQDFAKMEPCFKCPILSKASYFKSHTEYY